jgi:hypothetical protein
LNGGHTPGPWLIDGTTVYALNGEETNRFTCQVQGGHVAFRFDKAVRTSTFEREANARLIAAAPELLEALEGMLRASVTGGIEDAELNALEAKARAAIAKARGAAQ